MSALPKMLTILCIISPHQKIFRHFVVISVVSNWVKSKSSFHDVFLSFVLTFVFHIRLLIVVLLRRVEKLFTSKLRLEQQQKLFVGIAPFWRKQLTAHRVLHKHSPTLSSFHVKTMFFSKRVNKIFVEIEKILMSLSNGYFDLLGR